MQTRSYFGNAIINDFFIAQITLVSDQKFDDVSARRSINFS